MPGRSDDGDRPDTDSDDAPPSRPVSTRRDVAGGGNVDVDLSALGEARLAPGTCVRDYIVQDVIAAGGFGTVYRVQHTVLGRPAAFKVLHGEVASSEGVARFEREARAVNLIRHRNVVDIYDIGRLSDGRPYFVMELLDGEDLESIVRRKGRLPPDDVLEIMQPLCDALTAAHGAGIVHRDIKASNVMLVDEADGTRVVLLDFGVAKLLGPGEQGLTNSHHAIGTPTAMSPEQIAGGTVDARTDVYALGNLAFHLLTGELPFAAELSPVLMMHMHLHTQPPRPSQRAPVGNAFDEVVLRAMRKDAADRYPTASAFFDALRDAGEQLSGRGRAVAAGATRVIAVHVGLLVDEEHLENPDERLLDDLESVLPMAVERLNGRGFLTALETGTSLLLLRRISGDGRERDVLIAEVTAVLELHDALQYRAEKDERVHVNLCLHAGEAILAGSKVIGGAVTEVASWVPGGWVEGVVATAEAVSDLPLSVESVAEGCAVVRVIGVQGR